MADQDPAAYVWLPPAETLERANLTRFMRRHQLTSFDQLQQQSVEDVGWFTAALLEFLGIEFSQPYKQILDLSEGIAWPHWCVGGRLNIIHNCLDRYLGSETSQQPALLWEGEEGQVRELSYQELAAEVGKAANALRSLGVGPGDGVGLYMPLTPEEVIALLAVGRIGAIALPLFSGYGAAAVASRLQDARAKALITADGFFRNGSLVEMKPTVEAALERLDGLEHVIVLRRAGNQIPMTAGRDHWWHDLVEAQPAEAEPADTSAEDPLMILYTSGTTGRPKGAVHTHCGFPIKAAQDMAFGMDVQTGDRIYWITDMGWMMGPWLVFGALLLGATMFLYDGSPAYPGVDRTWQLVEQHRLNQLGLSPTFIRALMPAGSDPVERHDLSSLRAVGSTGEAWNPDPWHWLFEVVCRRQIPIINYSGGTEISGGILMGNPITPLKATAFSAPCPGIDADIFGAEGRPLVGQVGELVIKTPWIGQTRGFWQDPDRYLETYWSRWPDVWVHGDWARVDEQGSWYILGRSDDTLNIAGKRLGPAEVESILVAHPQVVEAAAIGVPHSIKGTALVAFCVLRSSEAGPELHPILHEWIVAELGKPLAPQALIFLDDLPKTRNAKLMRRMLRAAYLGEDPGDTSALVNPDVLAQVRAAGEAGG